MLNYAEKWYAVTAVQRTPHTTIRQRTAGGLKCVYRLLTANFKNIKIGPMVSNSQYVGRLKNLGNEGLSHANVTRCELVDRLFSASVKTDCIKAILVE